MQQYRNNDSSGKRPSSPTARQSSRSVPPQRKTVPRTPPRSSASPPPRTAIPSQAINQRARNSHSAGAGHSSPRRGASPYETGQNGSNVRRSYDDYNITNYNSSPRSGRANKGTDNSKGGKDKEQKKNSFGSFLKVSFLVLLVLIFAVIGVGAGAYLGIIKNAPDLGMISVEPNVYTSIIYDMNGTEIDRFHGEENREYVTFDKIPVELRNAIVAIEDERFYNHDGVDYKGVARATYVTVKGKLSGSGRTEGASTITQQLIKNNVTKVMRNNLKSKIQEQYLAVKYEKDLTEKLGSKKAAKDYILELYLNTIGLNEGYNGVQAASIGYFNKDVSELNLAECACIAGITNNPSYYTPREHPENNKERQKRILSNMLEQGYITEQEYSNAINDDIYSRVVDKSITKVDTGKVVHSYFVDALFEQISEDLQQQYRISVAQANNILYNSGLQIYSTLDPSIQQIVDDAYLDDSLFPNVDYKIDVTYTVSVEDSSTGKQEHSEYKQFVKSREEGEQFVANKKSEIESGLSAGQSIVADNSVFDVEPQSAMVILDYRTGEVKALAGGRGDKLVNRGFNRATDSARQPGSVFKVLAAFAPGIDMGKITPASVFDDVPYSVGGYSPKNWYSNPPYRGLSTVREGIRDSMNIVAVKSIVKNEISSSLDYLENFGFSTIDPENDVNAAIALGGLTKGVTQLEVTAAFGTIANNGAYNRPMLYSKVLDHDGNVILENAQESRQVLKKTSAYLLTNMMEDVIKSGTGTKASLSGIGIPVAGKTGTTQESRDLTFVGYTPYYVAGVWLGYDRYDSTVKNMENLDQSAHLVLWKNIMQKAHNGLSAKNFEKPEGITTATICTESGLLAGNICSSDPRGTVKTEFFTDGTQPTAYCNVHKSVSICKASGMGAGSYCPSSSIVSSVGIVRPEPYNGGETIGDRKYEVGHVGVCNVHGSGSGQTAKTNESENPDEEVQDTDESENETEAQTQSPAQAPVETTTAPDVSLGEIVPSVPQEQPQQSSQTTQEPETGNTAPAQPVMPEVSDARRTVDSFEF